MTRVCFPFSEKRCSEHHMYTAYVCVCVCAAAKGVFGIQFKVNSFFATASSDFIRLQLWRLITAQHWGIPAPPVKAAPVEGALLLTFKKCLSE